MALFKKSELRKQASFRKLTNSLVEASFEKMAKSVDDRQFDIFLSHSYLDASEISVLSSEFETMGYSVYVDWLIDGSLDRKNVTGNTAQLLRRRMQNCKCLFFATSSHSQESKWMPWELGYFDGLKDKVAIVPVVEDSKAEGDDYSGQEYLSIYPYVGKTPIKGSGKEALWVHDSHQKYVSFNSWLSGSKPKVQV